MNESEEVMSPEITSRQTSHPTVKGKHMMRETSRKSKTVK